jgi:hypothetical protein
MQVAFLSGLLLLCCTSVAGAQVPATDKKTDVQQSTGRTTIPEEKGQLQPQGWTGPIDTSSGGAPAESPQGQSPPGMQAAPEGSSKTVVEPAKK